MTRARSREGEPVTSRARARVVWAAAAGLVLLVAGGWAAAHRSPDPAAVRVGTLVLRRGRFVRTVRAEGTLRAVDATPVRVPGNDVSLKVGWIAEDGTVVRSGDVVVRLDPSETRRLLALGEAEKATAVKKGDKERAESGAVVANLGRDARQAHDELETARTFQAKDPELFSRHEIIEADIDVDLAGHREGYADGSRKVRSGLSRAALDLLSVDEKKAGLKIDKARKELAALEVKAPHDGLFLLKRNWRGELIQVGQTVWSGQVLGEIPDLASVEAEVFVLEADAGGLAPGRPVTVELEAEPGVKIEGKIKSVDSLARPRVRGVPVQYFSAVVALTATDPSRMKPGERVAATLHLGEEADVLVAPRHALFDRGGKRVVYVRGPKGFAPREVKVGAAGVGRVVLASGVADGDEIALEDPLGGTAGELPSRTPGAGAVPLGGAR